MRNLLEEAVREMYRELRARDPNACGCEQCEQDALAFVLNKTRPRYTGGSPTGVALTALDLQRDQTRAEIAVVVLEAIRVVAATPRHKQRVSGPRGGDTST